jgi:hypothetical protein
MNRMTSIEILALAMPAVAAAVVIVTGVLVRRQILRAARRKISRFGNAALEGSDVPRPDPLRVRYSMLFGATAILGWLWIPGSKPPGPPQ